MSDESKHTTDPKLLKFLSQPAAYPHDPDEIEHIQTHISHVFMAGSYVYKIKKPVNFDFLDYSTLEKRHQYCQREVELNRRLTDDVYLGVVPIVREGDDYRLESEEDGTVVEYAVKMKRLSEKYFLHSFVDEDALEQQHLDRVAEKLAGFYQQQQPGEEVLEWGKIGQIRYNTDENFLQTYSFRDRTIRLLDYEVIKEFTNRYYEENEDLFRRRINQKCIIDGHGDLHLEHIHLAPDCVSIYDCIEFNDRFRYGDWAADLAFLVMDLDFYGCWRESQYFVDRMAEMLEDEELVQIIDFYKCYRAYVKGKVKSLQSDDEEVPPEQRREAFLKADRYFGYSLRYALLGSHPIVLIVMGRVGSGKTTLASQLAERLDIEHYSSDIIRKQMAGVPLEERTPEQLRPDLYSREQSDKTYKRLYDIAEEQYAEGRSTILDATFSDRNSRGELVDRLKELGIDFLFIEVQAPDELIRERLQQREEQENVISDARLEDFESLNRSYVTPDEREEDHLITIHTDQSINDTLSALFKELIDRHLKKNNITE